jgi:hypothetical protein
MSGKGDSPRNCFSQEFRDGYDNINWGTKRPKSISRSIDGKYPCIACRTDFKRDCPDCHGNRNVPLKTFKRQLKMENK